MIELPEAASLANQLNLTIAGKRIAAITAGYTPHKLAWYYGEPESYFNLLNGRTVAETVPVGSMVEIQAESARVLFAEGINLRFHGNHQFTPDRHQMLITFGDGASLSASVQMYGGIGAFREGELDNVYYTMAKYKPSPLTPVFDSGYFSGLISEPEVQSLSLKALLATGQRIPGLGNGILQDILFNANLHPKRKVNSLSTGEVEGLFKSVKNTIADMASNGGRDTERDIFGKPGGYNTVLSKNTAGKPCPCCGTVIKKEAYMGGSIYFCPECQNPG